MNVLILYAHPEPKSFTAALKDTALKSLSTAGHVVEVSDLYGQAFNPVGGANDFKKPANAELFHYQTEQLHASRNDGFVDEIVREQNRLLRAELIVIVFPLWWGGTPAILKGWFERVCAYGVAYADGKRFDRGYFRGRRAVLGVSTGGTVERFTDGNSYGSIQRVLYPIQRCMLEYLGLEVLDPFVAYAAPRVSDDDRRAYLQNWGDFLLAAASDEQWEKRRFLLADDASRNRAIQDGATWNSPT